MDKLYNDLSWLKKLLLVLHQLISTAPLFFIMAKILTFNKNKIIIQMKQKIKIRS